MARVIPITEQFQHFVRDRVYEIKGGLGFLA